MSCAVAHSYWQRSRAPGSGTACCFLLFEGPSHGAFGARQCRPERRVDGRALTSQQHVGRVPQKDLESALYPRPARSSGEVLESHADPGDGAGELAELCAHARVHVIAYVRRQLQSRRPDMQWRVGGGRNANGSLLLLWYCSSEFSGAVSTLARSLPSCGALPCSHQPVPGSDTLKNGARTLP
jgi:hypothetical protein